MADDTDMIALTIDVVSAFVGHNNIRPEDLPAFIASTHSAIRGLETSSDPSAEQPSEEEHKPAVSARKSLGSKDHIISMIDGKPYKTLRRHLATHGLTPDSYRARYKLPTSYPMVAENYSATRRDLARKIGLGRKSGSSAAASGASGEGGAPAKRAAPRKPRTPKAQAPA
ncbi:MAG: MucR family transcriptional regulator [Sphingomonadaceae bacterium]|nr:MucR family transcriptional regulator [Sphingomonadaceae bacterium]